MKIKRKFIPIFFILLFILIIAIYYNNYPINNSNESIQNYLINKNHINYKDAVIQKEVDIKDTKIVILKYSGYSIQYALFKKGLNGKYKFLYVTSKNDLTYRSFIEKIQNDYYIITLGYNPKESEYIHTILTSSSFIHKNYSEIFNIKSEKYFIKYKIIIGQNKNNYGIASYYIDNNLK